VGLVVAVHILAAVLEARLGFTGLWDGLVFERDVRFRVSAGGQHADMIWAGDAYRLWTSVVLHADGLHLLVNGIALVALGRLMEPWVGARRLWAWFWLGGVLGSLASWGAGITMSDGASGGAFALLGAAAVIGGRMRGDLVPEDARLVGPVLWGFIALNVVLSVALPFVDGTAHLAGLLAGLLLGGLVGRKQHPALSGLEIFWLTAVAILLGLGWFWPELFRPY
jgi:membrane associated rhomboid family serine protease